MSLVNILYNYQLLRFAGENVSRLMASSCMRRSCLWPSSWAMPSAATPIVSYHYGARNHAELNNLYSKSLRLIGVIAVVMTALSMLVIPYVARIFVGYDAELLALTSHAFRVYALNFFLMGFNVYGSSFFTALGDGVTSALISFLRTLLFQLLALIFLPMVLGIEGVWLAVTAAEAGALCVTVRMFITKDKFPLPQGIMLKRKAVGKPPRPFCCLFKMIFHQLTVFDAGGGVLLVGHVVEIGLHHPGDAVVGHEKIGLVLILPQLVQQIINALGQLHHALAVAVAVGKVGLGDAELCAVPGACPRICQSTAPAGAAHTGRAGRWPRPRPLRCRRRGSGVNTISRRCGRRFP